MKVYWDSSALLDMLIGDEKARSAFASDDYKITRCHTLAETFSHLTGGRLGFRAPVGEAVRQILDVAPRLEIVSLDPKQTLAALQEARSRGVRGGAIHDFLHAYAAELHGCEKIITNNVSHFQAVTDLEAVEP